MYKYIFCVYSHTICIYSFGYIRHTLIISPQYWSFIESFKALTHMYKVWQHLFSFPSFSALQSCEFDRASNSPLTCCKNTVPCKLSFLSNYSLELTNSSILWIIFENCIFMFMHVEIITNTEPWWLWFCKHNMNTRYPWLWNTCLQRWSPQHYNAENDGLRKTQS